MQMKLKAKKIFMGYLLHINLYQEKLLKKLQQDLKKEWFGIILYYLDISNNNYKNLFIKI